MKHLNTRQQLNKASENLNISDVSRSFTIKDLKRAFYGAKSLIPDGEIVSPKLVEEFKTFEEWYKENYD